jgi:hypothetical protein
VTWKKTYTLNFGLKVQEEKVDGVFQLITNLESARYGAKRVL